MNCTGFSGPVSARPGAHPIGGFCISTGVLRNPTLCELLFAEFSAKLSELQS